MVSRTDLASLPRWGFAFPGPLRDELTQLALDGRKTTTAGLYAELLAEGETLSGPGDREILLDSDERPVAVIEIVECLVVRLAEVDDRDAIDEGEGYANAAEFRVAHEGFWNGYLDDLRRSIDPGFTIDDDTLVTVHRFKVVERLDPDDGTGEAGEPSG